MKLNYPVIINTKKDSKDKYYTVYIPDFDIYTEGKDIDDCIKMAQDAIALNCLALEKDLQKPFSKQSNIKTIKCNANQIVRQITIDYDKYKRQNDCNK